MDTPFIADETFKNVNYSEVKLPKGEYENCVFEGCDFSEGYLDNQNFMECEFIDCNLSNANVAHTIFKEVTFFHCKMMGLKLEQANDFLMDIMFNNCILNFSSFHAMDLKSQKFDTCKLIEVDFSEADLSNSVFADCYLDKAVFEKTNLENADLRRAKDFTIDPEKNRIKNAKFSKENVLGLLAKYNIVIT